MIGASPLVPPPDVRMTTRIATPDGSDQRGALRRAMAQPACHGRSGQAPGPRGRDGIAVAIIAMAFLVWTYLAVVLAHGAADLLRLPAPHAQIRYRG